METDDRGPEAGQQARPPEAHGSPGVQTERPARQAPPADPTGGPPPADSQRPDGRRSPAPAEAGRPGRPWGKWLLLVLLAAGLAAGGYYAVPWVVTALNTVSTDDAYVNGHVTFVAPRVSGQVVEVLVDDNYRVKKGDVLVRLDKVPFQVQVEIKQAAVQVAQANLVVVQAQVRAQIAQARANRFKLEHAIEDVRNQTANLRAAVATLKSRQATLKLARANLKRGEELAPSGAVSKEDLDQRRQSFQVAEANVDQALQNIYAIRAGLGLTTHTTKPEELGEVPPNLEQNYSAVREALGQLLQSAAQFGYVPASFNATPQEAITEFYKQDPQGNLDRIYAHLIPNAPAIKQAEAMLDQARQDLDQALLNLWYTDIVSEIDGVVTRRNVNPGNNVAVGQSLMAVRSLKEIWIDCNFKETQLADLRIGQRVRCEVDMYGSRKEFEGRITGFTMGTGESLALLPPQNATGNFVKIVQRLPVRVELTDYDPDKTPLFVGTSVVPYVYYKEPATGPHAGKVLQPLYPLPQLPTASTIASAIGQAVGQAPLWQVGWTAGTSIKTAPRYPKP
jgi:membrane fusion protein (multidrug efflux system)